MSTDEQMAMIGRLMVERKQANQKRALLEHEIKEYAKPLGDLSSCISRLDDTSRIQIALSVCEGLAAKGGIDKLAEAVAEYRALTQKIAEIGVTLRNAGAE